MYLTKEEERMLDGEYGEVVERFMRLLVKLGDVYGAERMVRVGSSQIAGISYKNIGDPGLEFLEGLVEEGARVVVPSYMNPAGMDLEYWKEIGIPDDFASKQKRIIEALRKIGVMVAATCTPYLAGLLPRYGEHIAWSESSAVIFANSVIGARTNREGGPSALAAAITGRTPMYGYHLDENREPTFVVEVETDVRNSYDFGLLAFVICDHLKKGVPIIRGIDKTHANVDRLKLFGATLASYGAFAIYHIDGVTPERFDSLPCEKISVGGEEIKDAYERMVGADDGAEIVVIGCPHSSVDGLKKIAEKLKGKRMRIPMWVFTSRSVRTIAERTNLLGELREANVTVFADTCPVVMPLDILGIKKVATNSGKALFYLPNTNNVEVSFASLDELIGRFSE